MASLSSCCGIEPVTRGVQRRRVRVDQALQLAAGQTRRGGRGRRVAGVERRARRHRRGQPRRGARIDDDHAAERHRHDAVLAGGDLRVAEARHLVEQVVALVEQVVRVLPDGLELRDRGVQARDLRGVRVDLRRPSRSPGSRCRRAAHVSVVEAVWNDSPSACADCASAWRAPESSGWSRRSARPTRSSTSLPAGRSSRAPGSADSMPCQVVCRTSASPWVREGRAQVVVVELVADPRDVRRPATPWPSWPGRDHAPHGERAERGLGREIARPGASTRRCWRSRCCGWSCRATPARPARPLSAMLRPLKVEIGIRPSHPAGRGCPRRGRRGPSTSTAPRVSACGRSRRSWRARPRSASG